MAQWVKDLVLTLLWCRFDPWSGYFCMLQAWKKIKIKKKKRCGVNIYNGMGENNFK